MMPPSEVQKLSYAFKDMKQAFPQLVQYGILPGPALRGALHQQGRIGEAAAFKDGFEYLFVQLDPKQGPVTRNDAVAIFQELCEERLGWPSTDGGAENEVLPKRD